MNQVGTVSRREGFDNVVSCVATKMVPTDSHTELAARVIHHRFAPKDGSKPFVAEKEYCQYVTWHVDDLKMSHAEANVVTRMIKWLRATCK